MNAPAPRCVRTKPQRTASRFRIRSTAKKFGASISRDEANRADRAACDDCAECAATLHRIVRRLGGTGLLTGS
jgi:hypothetical protein